MVGGDDEDALAAEEVDDTKNVQDETDTESRKSTPFNITAFGGDPSVFDLVRRMNSGRLKPPPFQRAYVWTLKDASRFVETLLMGLPVPGIFVFKDVDNERDLIIDGQQRLLTLKYYTSDGILRGKEFRLSDVAEPWNGKTFKDLDENYRSIVEESVIHVTYFKQDHPAKGDRSIYEVFERINTGGLKLSAQEIRTCVSYGEFVKLLSKLNENQKWREIYGKPSPRLKDVELILRFLALLEDLPKYSKPMRQFLDEFLSKNRIINPQTGEAFSKIFEDTITVAHSALGRKAFRPVSALNAAVFDAVMIGLALRLKAGGEPNGEQVKLAYESLIKKKEFIDAYVKSTADEESVRNRIRLATEVFANV